MADNEKKEKSKVVNFEKEKAKRDGDEKPPKHSAALVHRNIARILSPNPIPRPQFVTKPEYQYLVGEINGKRSVYRILDGDVLRVVNERAVCSTILRWIEVASEICEIKEYQLTHTQALQCAKYFIETAEPFDIEAVPIVRFANQPGYCFHRINGNYDPTPETPVADDYFSRWYNAEAAQMFFGSLGVDGSYRQQYLYIQGEPGVGKSLVCKIMKMMLGDAATYLAEPGSNSAGLPAHWTMGVENKALGIFDDVDNMDFIGRGAFRSLTGNDYMSVNRKGGDIVDVPNKCRFVFTSNYPPGLKNAGEDLRRIIYCMVAPPKNKKLSEMQYESALLKEWPAKFSKMIKAYDEKYPDRRMIECDTEKANAIASLNDDFEFILETGFCTDSRTATVQASVLRRRVERICNHLNLRCDQNYINRFCRWLIDEKNGLGIDKKETRKCAVYRGVAIKEWSGINTDKR